MCDFLKNWNFSKLQLYGFFCKDELKNCNPNTNNYQSCSFLFIRDTMFTHQSCNGKYYNFLCTGLLNLKILQCTHISGSCVLEVGECIKYNATLSKTQNRFRIFIMTTQAYSGNWILNQLQYIYPQIKARYCYSCTVGFCISFPHDLPCLRASNILPLQHSTFNRSVPLKHTLDLSN